jgi:hypothetical protein
MTAFWEIALCSLLEVDGRFRGVYCSIIRAIDGSILTTALNLKKESFLRAHDYCFTSDVSFCMEKLA